MRRGRLVWIIQVISKWPSQMSIQEGGRGGFDTCTKEKTTWRWRQKSQRWSHKSRFTSNNLVHIKRQRTDSSLQLLEWVYPKWQPGFQPYETDFKFLPSRAVIVWICFVLISQICGDLLQHKTLIQVDTRKWECWYNKHLKMGTWLWKWIMGRG